MDRPPLPPHERSWRHPSELGPPPHEPTSTGGRVLIATTATLGLLLVGLMVVTMTPDRAASPTTQDSTVSGARSAPATAVALGRPDLPVVTPVGDDGWAVTTVGAVAGLTGSMTARLPTGEVVDVEIVKSDPASGLAVVSLPEAAGAEGYDLADWVPGPSDTVLVHGETPMVVTMVDLADIDVAEATPVLDDEGNLIGLCAEHRGEMALMTVATVPGPADDGATATTVTPTLTARPTTPPSTSAPTTSAPTLTTIATAPTTPATVDPSVTTAPMTPAPTTADGPTRSTVPAAPGTGNVNGGGVATTAPR